LAELRKWIPVWTVFDDDAEVARWRKSRSTTRR